MKASANLALAALASIGLAGSAAAQMLCPKAAGASFTYLLIPSKIGDANKKAGIADFLKWMLADGQKDCAALGYAAPPQSVMTPELKQIGRIQ